MSYSLDTPQHCLGWTAAQEMTISRDYPFANLQSETPDQYVVRNYLQFLWLPDVRMNALPTNTHLTRTSLSCQ